MDTVNQSAAVLVTGATGFIGRQVVRYLLARGRTVVAMGRSLAGASASARVLNACGAVPDGSRLQVIEADLTDVRGSLAAHELRQLRQTVETVIHCAGDTSFFPADMDRFRSGHIDGPLALLTALHGGRLQRWGYLSSAYVCGRRSGTVFEGERDVDQDFHNPYERVKLEAEMAMQLAGGHLGIDVRIFRPSIVVGAAPDTSGGQPSNLFFAFIQLLATLAHLPHTAHARIRIEAAPHARFNIVPVEYVAEAMVALAEAPEAAGQTFHLVVAEAPTQYAVLTMLADFFGLHGLSLQDLYGRPLDSPSALERRVARLGSAYHEYLRQDVHFDDRAARGLLDRLGIPRPTLTAQDMQRIIGQALGCVTSRGSG